MKLIGYMPLVLPALERSIWEYDYFFVKTLDIQWAISPHCFLHWSAPVAFVKFDEQHILEALLVALNTECFYYRRLLGLEIDLMLSAYAH